MSIDDSLHQVREFHRHIGAPVAEAPRLLTCDPTQANQIAARLLELSLVAANLGSSSEDELLKRLGMALEELSEWLFAHARGDLVAAADAWADRLYVLLGDAVATGLPAAALFAEIHRSNLTKQGSLLSWPGKAVKGSGFQAPGILRVLDAAKAPKTGISSATAERRHTRVDNG